MPNVDSHSEIVMLASTGCRRRGDATEPIDVQTIEANPEV